MAPTREELLSIVRKHSSSLDPATKGDGADTQVDMRFWQEMLDMFFVKGRNESKASDDDDLIFFVRSMSLQCGDNGEEKSDEQPYFVRRWALELTKVVGDSIHGVDWRRSFYLNLVAHTSYVLTVAICSLEALRNHNFSPLSKITKTVYASPSRSDFQSKSSKASETVSSYPNIFFMVDDYDEAFENLILSEEDQCYCVQLHASGGAAFTNPSSSDTKITLFSGLIDYRSVRTAFGGSERFGGVLNIGKSERVVMRGPGQRGQVDVMVYAHNHSSALTSTSAEASRKTSGIGSIVRKATVVALAAKAYLATSSDGDGDGDDDQQQPPLPLRCCLMTLSLPWESIAYDLLKQ